jgi:hypothetical protein
MQYYAASNHSLFSHMAFAVIVLLFGFSFSVRHKKSQALTAPAFNIQGGNYE